MTLPVRPPVAPMLARLTRELPCDGYLYEPKWDGFRCLAFGDRDEIELRSRNDRPVGRYFPEIVEAHARPARGAAGQSPRSAATLMTTIEIEGRKLALTNLDKVFWPEPAMTKGQMLEYYARVARRCCRTCADGR
jgi:hypothetical protein